MNIDDLLFIIRYMPKALYQTTKQTLLGAAVGLLIGYANEEHLSLFAKEHHDAVDFPKSHVPDAEEFLHFSTGPRNRVTPPIRDYLLPYSTLIGASSGLLFACCTVPRDFIYHLNKNRCERELFDPMREVVVKTR